MKCHFVLKSFSGMVWSISIVEWFCFFNCMSRIITAQLNLWGLISLWRKDCASMDKEIQTQFYQLIKLTRQPKNGSGLTFLCLILDIGGLMEKLLEGQPAILLRLSMIWSDWFYTIWFLQLKWHAFTKFLFFLGIVLSPMFLSVFSEVHLWSLTMKSDCSSSFSFHVGCLDLYLTFPNKKTAKY